MTGSVRLLVSVFISLAEASSRCLRIVFLFIDEEKLTMLLHSVCCTQIPSNFYFALASSRGNASQLEG